MTALSRIRQVGIKIEGTSGTAESLVAADFSRNVTDLSFVASATRYSRNILRAALTKIKDLVGGKLVEISWTEEMPANTGSTSTDGIWYPTLQGMGMQKNAQKLQIITVGSISGGSFAGGDTITASGGKSGRVAAVTTISGATKIIYQPMAGTFADMDSISNGTATGTQSGSPADAGWTHRPMSENGSQVPPTATVEYHDPNYTERAVGAMGDGSVMAKWGEVLKLQSRYRGPRQIKTDDGTPLDPGLVSSVTAGPTPRKLLGNTGLPIRLGGWAGVLTEIQVKFNNTLTDRKTLSEAGVIGSEDDLVKCGYMPERITDRRVEITLDPETPAEATMSLMKNWNANTDMLFHAQLGTLLASGDKAICINCPKVSLAQDSFQQQDRDGINTLGLTLLATGASNDDDEIYIDHVMIP
jgi:hypothetical protein